METLSVYVSEGEGVILVLSVSLTVKVTFMRYNRSVFIERAEL